MIAGLLASLAVAAEQQVNVVSFAMDQVSWEVQSDRFLCKLELGLEKNGQLVFVHSAGQRGIFRFTQEYQSVQEVKLASMTAPWMPSGQSDWVDLDSDGHVFQLSEEHSASLLNSLDSGLWTRLLVGTTEIVIPTVRWQSVRAQYQECKSALSPMSVQQARDNVLLYMPGQIALTEHQLELLDRLAGYVRIDTHVSRILIDGHTDNVGSRLANLQQARQRANDVAAVLVSGGVDKRLLEIRAHGDRYPVSDNRTPEGRDQNRRVTIRVIRQDGQDNS